MLLVESFSLNYKSIYATIKQRKGRKHCIFVIVLLQFLISFSNNNKVTYVTLETLTSKVLKNN